MEFSIASISLARGKRKDNGEWVYGNLIVDKLGDDNGNTIYGILQDRNALAMVLRVPIVIPETIGFFTGKTDRSDQKIFSGDIVRDYGFYGKTTEIELVEYSDTQAAFIVNENSDAHFECLGELNTEIDLEIIGNKWDNPELLENKQ